jgi:hypothetical protein
MIGKPILLLGDDARKFLRQIRHGRPSRAAKEAVARGLEMARELAENGFVRVSISRDSGSRAKR